MYRQVFGAPRGNRTPDQEIRRLLLYPLSYRGGAREAPIQCSNAWAAGSRQRPARTMSLGGYVLAWGHQPRRLHCTAGAQELHHPVHPHLGDLLDRQRITRGTVETPLISGAPVPSSPFHEPRGWLTRRSIPCLSTSPSEDSSAKTPSPICSTTAPLPRASAWPPPHAVSTRRRTRGWISAPTGIPYGASADWPCT